MRVWGKLLGFLFGFMLSKNLFGALLGMWLGHTFDRGRSFDFNHLGHQGDEDRQAEFLYCTFSSMGFVAKSDGQVSSQEIAFATAYMDKLGLKGELREQAQAAFREGKMADFPLETSLLKFKRNCINLKDLLMLFLEIQIQVAFADGQLDTYERKALHRIAQVLGFSASELDQLLEMIIAGAQFHQQGNQGQSSSANNSLLLDNAYKLLGVERSSSDKEIKKAYRKLMAQHHPDKLVAKGLPPEMMDIAKQKTQDIQAAYEMITKAK
jgi:DnaJ like chaperone protein